MRTRTPYLALAAIAALGAYAAPAIAAPTATKITSPADPAFITYSSNGASSLAVTGSSNGGRAKLDIRCDGTTSILLKPDVVPNGHGNFGTTIPASTMAKLAGQYCSLHAVPANSTSGSPGFAGVRLAVASLALGTVKSGAIINYRVKAPQISGRGEYGSVGTCGIEGSATFSSRYTVSSDVFTCAARLSNDIGARSALQIDGQNAYTPAGAATLFPNSSNLPGLQPLTVSVTGDPATGNVTIRESETLVKCAPDATTWPVNPATCTSFVPAAVRLDRTVVQSSNGRQASVIDAYTSLDGAAHKVSAIYENAATSGAAFQFPWLAPTYTLYSTNYLVPPSPVSPFTFFAKYASAADGDTHHDVGAAVVQLSPTAMAFKSPTSLWVQEDRSVPPSGPLTMGFAYAWGATGTEVASAAAAIQPALAVPCVVPRTLNMTVAQARDSFRRAGCQLGSVRKEPSSKFKKFRIKAQSSNQGAKVPSGTKINITLSWGVAKLSQSK
jgi:hypothetical protein